MEFACPKADRDLCIDWRPMSIKENDSVNSTDLFLPSYTFFIGDCGDSAKSPARKRWYGRLHAYFDCLKGTKGNVGDKFGGSAGGEVE